MTATQPELRKRLEGKFAAEVFDAPKTGCDPECYGKLPAPHERVVSLLESRVAGEPWADQLALVAVVLSARRRDVRTIITTLETLIPRFRDLFAAFGLKTIADWCPERHIPAYLKGEVLPTHTHYMRASFWSKYSGPSKQVKRWFDSLPEADRQRYLPFLLPVVNPLCVEGLIDRQGIKREQQQKRKTNTDAVLPHFSLIRSEAHIRFNYINRVYEAYCEAINQVKAGHNLPFEFFYYEGGDPELNIPAQERLHFRVWDRRNFVLHHEHLYSRNTIARATEGSKGFAEDRNGFLLEFVKAERLVGDAPPQGLWFIDLLRMNALNHSKPKGRAALKNLQSWFRSWGYGDEDKPDENVFPFKAGNRALFSWPREDGTVDFVRTAREHAEGTLLPIESLRAAAAFGLAALDFFTTTGMRMNEAMQVRPEADCLVRLVMSAPPGAKDQSPRVRYVLRLIPKGERTDTPQNYFIGKETMRVMTMVVRVLGKLYGIDVEKGGKLPVVPFDPYSARAHRFGNHRYLFQYNFQHLTANSITACMRFLLHGITFKNRDGKLVVISSHLLRHAFATHLVHVEKVPMDVVRVILNQKDLSVTEYYSRPTEGVVAEAADQFLARIDAHVDVGQAVLRTPDEIEGLRENARGRIGTLTDVPGGECTSHGFCPPKYVCIGCAGKAPNPRQRHQVEAKRKWALDQIEVATAEGMLVEVERMKKLVRDCDIELQEMDLIEAYRRDECRAPQIKVIEPGPK